MAFSEKIRKIEKLIERASFEGEKEAALLAKARLLERQEQLPVDYLISHHNLWKKKLFTSLCQKYGLSPYRRKRQKQTTTCVSAPPALMKNVLWPAYKKYVDLLEHSIETILARLTQDIFSNSEQNDSGSNQEPALVPLSFL